MTSDECASLLKSSLSLSLSLKIFAIVATANIKAFTMIFETLVCLVRFGNYETSRKAKFTTT